jgi:hypothetical protein
MLARFDKAADEAQSIIHNYQLALVGLYQTVLQGPAPTSPRARYQMSDEIQRAEHSVLSTFTSKLQAASELVLDEALSSSFPGLSDAAREQIKGSITDARNDLNGVILQAILKDAEQTNRALRDFALKVDMAMNAARISYSQALYNVRNQQDGMTYFQVDRTGKRWATTNYVKTSVRGFLVKTYVEGYLYGLAHKGDDLAKVVYPEDPEHLHNGTVFSITGSSQALPAYQTIKGEIWHPNTRALVSNA